MSEPETSILSRIRAEHAKTLKTQRLDGFLYNGGIVLTVGLSGIATVLGALTAARPDFAWSWIAPILSGVATMWIAIDRSLTFGLRWRFHKTVSSAYKALEYRFLSMPLLDEADRAAELKSIRDAFVVLPLLDPQLPGIASGQPAVDAKPIVAIKNSGEVKLAAKAPALPLANAPDSDNKKKDGAAHRAVDGAPVALNPATQEQKDQEGGQV